MDCSPLGSSIPGILQARILGWVAIPFPRGFLDQGPNLGLLHCRRTLLSEPSGGALSLGDSETSSSMPRVTGQTGNDGLAGGASSQRSLWVDRQWKQMKWAGGARAWRGRWHRGQRGPPCHRAIAATGCLLGEQAQWQILSFCKGLAIWICR